MDSLCGWGVWIVCVDSVCGWGVWIAFVITRFVDGVWGWGVWRGCVMIDDYLSATPRFLS